MSNAIVAIDFDGTIVKHAYPDIGEPVADARRVIMRMQEAGWWVILWTMRSGEELAAAVDYCRTVGIELFGVNSNPEQGEWTQSPKAYAQVYIDDAALGCPLVHPNPLTQTPFRQERPWVDWVAVERAIFGVSP